MDMMDFLDKVGPRIPRGVARALEKGLRRLPPVRRQMEKEYARILGELRATLKPYRDVPTFDHLPRQGLSPDDVLTLMERLAQREESRWREGYISGTVYHGDPEHTAFTNQAYALYAQSNPLHAMVWPSTAKFEAEIVAMTAAMLGADQARETDPTARVCGSVTSGGTESILMAVKTHRDWARATKGITEPQMVMPVTAHPAFDKAGHYFGVKVVRTPVDENFRADVNALKKAINHNTILIVGSAPTFPHGIIDPIEEMSELARERGIGFHTDACLGGFVLPWAERLGYPVPRFDFRLPGVTSISVDTHKYGYAPKGTSVVLYRHPDLRRYQYFTATDWPGGLYVSPTIAGSRPGGIIAACWATMVRIGEEGYLEATRRILATAQRLRQGIEAIPELRVLGDPLWIIAFTSDELNIYQIMDRMEQHGWHLGGLQSPPAVHIAVTLRHTQPGVDERFIADLEESVAYVKAHPDEKGTIAPVYGMAASIPFRGMVDDLLRRYLDLLYEVDGE